MDNGRLARVAVAAVAVIALAGCSGESGVEPADDSPSAPGTEAAERVDPSTLGSRTRACRAEVEVSGDVEQQWRGAGTVRTGTGGEGPKAVYRLVKDESSLTVYSQGGGIAASANLSVDGVTYATRESDGIDATTKGRGATVRASATTVDGDVAEIEAEFVCGKNSKRQ